MWVIDVRETQGGFRFTRNLFSGVLSIGRDRQGDIVLPSSAVSRRHGQIEVRDGRLFFRDLDSYNGSKVDGRPVKGEVPIGVHARIEIGNYALVVEPDPANAESAEFTMLLEEEPPTREMVPADIPQTDSASALLAHRIRSIRSYRDEDSQKRAVEREHVDREWVAMLATARQLQRELSGDRRVQNFSISRTGDQISVKVADSRKNGGYAYFILSRRDPDDTLPLPHEVVWLREFGERDCHFREPREALEELVSRLAPRLA